MVILEFLLLALVVGTVGGVGWRLAEDYMERRDNRQIEQAGLPETATNTTKQS